ncbi:MAG TPA: hypothetical protein VGG73_02350 [Vicinamibacterales bacterium]
MSPEAAGILSRVDAALTRARLLAVGEAIAWGLLISAVSPLAGVLVALAVGLWRWRRATRVAVVRALETTHPELRNLLVTVEELSADSLVTKPEIRARVFADAAAAAPDIRVQRAFPFRPVARAIVAAVAVWTLVTAVGLLRRPGPGAGTSSGPLATQGGPAASAGLRVSATVQPPAYTGLKSATMVDPQQLTAVEGSDLALTVDSTAAAVTVDHDGVTSVLRRAPDGHFAYRTHLTTTGYLMVTTGGGDRRLMPVVVSPDGLPAVRVTAPGRDLVYAGGNPQITFNAHATDDYGVRSLSLHYTKVSGSGEQFSFKEGEIPLKIAVANARDWSGAATATLETLDLKDGDMLVYRAVASDARPIGGTASSDAFFIEVSKVGAAAADGFTVQEEETRYALSQQMLIVKTERLNKARASMPAADAAEASRNLAVEQRMIRSEFVFMLGGEVEDEEVEAQQSTDLQEGRLQNRGQRDLRIATVAMSQAEKFLTAANTADALIQERAAVTALQRAFARDRYILRAMATRSQLDTTRRLTGNLEGAADWHRASPALPENKRLAHLTDLLSSVATLTRDGDATKSAAFKDRALVLAEEAIRTDVASEALRKAATELQRAADAAGDPAVRSRALAVAAGEIATEARHAQADAALSSPSIAPGLSGAFADAIVKPRGSAR